MLRSPSNSRTVLLLALLGPWGICAAQSLALRVPGLTAPAGGTAQIQVFLASPAALVSGELTLALDPAVFGPIASADVFSVTGDQVGAANIQDRQVDVQFSSVTGGVGRRPDLPVLVVSAPVLATATAGATSPVLVKPGAAAWRGAENLTYTVTTAAAALFTVGGSLSITDLSPGGGLLPAGSPVRIDGMGFTAGSTVAIDGAPIAPVSFASSTELDFSLPGDMDLTGKQVVVSNPDGAAVTFFSALRGSYAARPSSGPFATIRPIFPQQLYAAGEPGNFAASAAAIALQNPNLQPVDVEVKSDIVFLDGDHVSGSIVTLPPGGIFVVPGAQVAASYREDNALVVPTAPIRMALIDPVLGGSLVPAMPVPLLQAFLQVDGSAKAFRNPYPAPLEWNLVAGKPATPVILDVVLTDLPAPFTASASTQSGGSWLSISPSQGVTCNGPDQPDSPTSCPDSAKVTVSVDTSNLGPGTYNATLAILPQAFGAQSSVFPVVLALSAAPVISLNRASVDFGPVSANSQPPSAIVDVSSNADPAAFSVSVITRSGQNWLSVSPLSGNTPATLTLTGNPAALPARGDSAIVTVTGPSNSQTIAVSMESAQPQPVMATPASFLFTLGTAEPPPAPEPLGIVGGVSISLFTITTQTSDGGNWLSVGTSTGPGVPYFTVSVNQTGLTPGTYHGTVTISSALYSAPAVVPVTLYVWSTPPPVIVNPAALSFMEASTASLTGASQTVNVSTGAIPMYYQVTTSTADGAPWLSVSVELTATFLEVPTPATVTVYALANLAPGDYHGTVTISAPQGSANSATVAVTLTVTPGPPPPPPQGTVPLATCMLNAASLTAGPVSPGEIVTIFGQNFGPSTPAGFALGPNGKVATSLGGAQVLFNGIAAPLLYANATQINAIVPYEAAGAGLATVQVQYVGTPIPLGGAPIADAAPGIFTPVLNQDNSINSPANAAARGSTVQIYATGEGLTTPAGITGEITGSDAKQPQLPVTVTIGGAIATIAYAASAPDAVAGLFQVNAVVPVAVAPGSAVPVLLTIGTARSPANVTIAVK